MSHRPSAIGGPRPQRKALQVERMDKARREWVAERNRLGDRLLEAKQFLGMVISRRYAAHQQGDIPAAAEACRDEMGAERYVGVCEAEVAAHKRAEPGRMY